MTTEAMKTLEAITRDKLSFGGTLRSLRLADEISQGDFAKTLGVTVLPE